MKFSKGLDLLLNIIVPMLLGLSIYLLKSSEFMPAVAKNHLADGLWAYSFMSTILIIWKREINVDWVAVAFIAALGFELLQGLHIIAGTGDIYDIISYFIFFIIALLLNHLFKTKLKTTTNATH